MMYSDIAFLEPFCIHAVLFDFDGTLTQPGALDFAVIKRKLGCPLDRPVLEFIEQMEDPAQRSAAHEELERFERDGALRSMPNPGAEDLIAHVRSLGLPMGLITRNSLESIKTALANFEQTRLSDFDAIVTRDDPVQPKPSAEGVLLAARQLNTRPEHILMVGDFVFDIQAGNRAGAITALLDTESNFDPKTTGSDFTVAKLCDLQAIIRMGLPLAPGKLPNDLLDEFLARFQFEDPSLLIQPGVGEDIAAADIDGEEVLILKSDPITFATDSAAYYAVTVNANDIATAGATPRWLITTLLFPVGSTGSTAWQIMNDLNLVARKFNIVLCGGHTEVTDAVTRPVIIGALAGTVTKDKLIDKRQLREGDRVLLTKSVAVEGTSIIAREFEGTLRAKGFDDSEIETCKAFIDHISIVEEAGIAADSGGVSAMHDVTEGGLATAVAELSIAGNHRIRVDMDRIPVFEQTRRLCQAFDISPLGLIGSGSLLICCRPEMENQLVRAIGEAGISAVPIGEVLGKGRGVDARQGSKPVTWPSFAVDELARLFQMRSNHPPRRAKKADAEYRSIDKA